MPSPNRLDLTIHSNFDDLERVVDETESFFSALSEDGDFIYTAVLLASEAATNSIEHGNQLDPTRLVKISYIVQDASVEMHFEDEGSGFNRADIPDPLSDENILDDGGRGIFLIERLADAVRYENGGRRVVIVLTRK